MRHIEYPTKYRHNEYVPAKGAKYVINSSSSLTCDGTCHKGDPNDCE